MLRDEVVYRPGVPADAGLLAAFGSEAFVEAFGHALHPGHLALHVAKTYSEEQQRGELEDPQAWTIIADRDGDIVAAAYLRWASPPARLAPEMRWAEIARFYLAKPYWRTGISSDLMVAALASIRERGGEVVWLQTWEHAEVAIRFYRKWGFLEVGETTFQLGPEQQRDLILARSLRPDLAGIQPP